MHPFIEEYLSDYIASQNFDYAMMLTGEWGAGKTFFVEDFIGRSLKTKEGKSEAVYVSVNGLTTTRQVTSAIVGSMNRIVGSEVFKGAIKCAAVAISAIANVSKEDSMDLFDSGLALLKIKAKLVVLDDLERCSVPINELLGYVANLIRDGVHVLLVCSEEELRKKCDNYDKIKEKVVGRTFKIPENIDVVYESILSDLSFKNIRNVLIRLRSRFINDFKSVPSACNYRAFKHAIRDFAYWHKHFKGDIQKNEAFIMDFAQKFIPLSYETQLGNLTRDNFGNGKNPFDEKEPPKDFDKILERHGIGRRDVFDSRPYLVLSDDTFYKMMFSDYITHDEINQEIMGSAYFIKPENKTEWQRLMDWDVLEDDEVFDLIEVVWSKVEKSEYVIPEEILHVFCLLCHLQEYGVVKMSMKSIVNHARRYIRTLRKSGILQPAQLINRIDSFGQSWGGYNFQGEFDNKEWYVSIRDELLSQTAAADDDVIRDWVCQNCPGGLDGDSSEFLCRIAVGGIWEKRPVFQFVNPGKFLDSFLKLTNKDKRYVGSALNSRYYYAGQKMKDAELGFWRSIVRRISKTAVPKKRSSAGRPSVLQLDILYNLINDYWSLGLPKAKMKNG